jgi:hypothetical protein
MSNPNGLLTRNMSPEQARLLDQQLRDKQFQGQQYGGRTGGFMTAASGAIQGAAKAGQGLSGMLTGKRFVGANEQEAVQAQQTAQESQQLDQTISKAAVSGQGDDRTARLKAEVNALRSIMETNPSAATKVAPRIAEKEKEIAQIEAEQAKQAAITEREDAKARQVRVVGNFVYDPVTRTFDAPKGNADTITEKDKRDMYKTFTRESVQAYLEDNSKPLIPADKGDKAGSLADNLRVEVLVDAVKETDVVGMKSKFSTVMQQSSLLENGLISGFGAGVLKNVAKIGSALGVLSPEQADVLATTETFESNAGNLVAEVIKAFGAGTGLSDADRDYAKQIAAGNIAMTELSMKRVLDIISRNTIQEMKDYNKKLEKLGGSWLEDKLEIPVMKRNDLSNLNTKTVKGVVYYIDSEYNEVYDSNGMLLPTRKGG